MSDTKKICSVQNVSFRWHNKFQNGFTNLNDGSRPGLTKPVVTNGNIAAMAGLIKRLTVKNIAHSVDISSGSACKILTQQLKLKKVCARCAPIA